MRIARFTTGEDPQYGVVAGELDDQGQLEDDAVIVALAGDPLYVGIKLLEQEHRLADVRLLAPVLPSKIIGIGKNYADHAKEMGGVDPTEPLMFLKPTTPVIGPDEAIVLPPESSEVHYEAELAVVIGRLCRRVPAEQAHPWCLGYTCANDVTARDLQRRDAQWTRAKGFDTFCPLGPWIDTDLDPAASRGRVRGQRPDRAVRVDTADLIFAVSALIEAASAVMTLLPGDVILTGTPAGVGPLSAGDEVAVTVSGLGTLVNPVR